MRCHFHLLTDRLIFCCSEGASGVEEHATAGMSAAKKEVAIYPLFPADTVQTLGPMNVAALQLFVELGHGIDANSVDHGQTSYLLELGFE
jgi:hypothetical protein